MSNAILKEETIYYPIKDAWGTVRVTSGLRLYMADGSVWFHPFTGEAPIQEKLPCK